jgi:hypothetical protein
MLAETNGLYKNSFASYYFSSRSGNEMILSRYFLVFFIRKRPWYFTIFLMEEDVFIKQLI